MAIWKNSDKNKPVVYMIGPGADVLNDTRRLCERVVGKTLLNISLGAGQDVEAARMFYTARQSGDWVLFQNTHVYESWMQSLVKLIDTLNEPDVNNDFRLFISTKVSPTFPVKILQDSIKVTIESSSDLKNMMLANMINIDEEEIKLCSNPYPLRRLTFSLVLFHALLVERRKYGPIGWINPYEFLNEDFNVSFSYLRNLFSQNAHPNYSVIQTVIAKIN